MQVPLVAASAQFARHSFTLRIAFAARELLAAAALYLRLPFVQLGEDGIALETFVAPRSTGLPPLHHYGAVGGV
jgi:hypothetical protein